VRRNPERTIRYNNRRRNRRRKNYQKQQESVVEEKMELLIVALEDCDVTLETLEEYIEDRPLFETKQQ
jgi:hypothetical protein